jgi:hypothetical protein
MDLPGRPQLGTPHTSSRRWSAIGRQAIASQHPRMTPHPNLEAL